MTFRRGAKRLAWRFARPVYRRMQRRAPQEFSIGIAVGDSPWALRLPQSIANPVLTLADVTDVPAAFVADPFMCQRDGRWFLFFEVFNELTRRGEIAVAVSRDALTWEYQRVVLAEPFHLSYPYVFESQGSYYMIPETAAARSVRLYRAIDFPFTWELIGNLLEGRRYADSSILFHGDKWWLFTDTGSDGKSPQLRLYFAEELRGPWHEHPSSPLRNDPHLSRPAGRVVVADGRPIQFVQDVYPVYGKSVSAFAVTKLTPIEYEEQRLGDQPILVGGDAAWNRHGMHHIDAHLRGDGSWIACVDGFGLSEAAKEHAA